jgi:hypothetical protein
MLGEGANRLRVERLSRHRPVGESQRLPDDRMLWKGTALMPFAHFPPSIQYFPMRVSSDGSHATYLWFAWKTELP